MLLGTLHWSVQMVYKLGTHLILFDRSSEYLAKMPFDLFACLYVPTWLGVDTCLRISLIASTSTFWTD